MGKHHKTPPKNAAKKGPTPSRAEMKTVKKFQRAATKVKDVKIKKATKAPHKAMSKKKGPLIPVKPNNISKKPANKPKSASKTSAKPKATTPNNKAKSNNTKSSASKSDTAAQASGDKYIRYPN